MKLWEKIAGGTWLVAMFIVCMILLVGCGSDSHKNMHCVQSHDEVTQVPIYGNHVIVSGKSTILIPYVLFYIPQHDNVCDKWVPNK